MERKDMDFLSACLLAAGCQSPDRGRQAGMQAFGMLQKAGMQVWQMGGVMECYFTQLIF